MEILAYLLNDYTFKVVSIGCIILGILSGVIGTFGVLKKESLLGDAVGHGALAGVCFVFIFFDTKDVHFLLFGAFIVGLIIISLIHIILTYSKVKQDSSIALLLSVFFGLGIVLLTYISILPGTKKAGLNRFIFGQASTILLSEVYQIIIVSIVLLFILILFYKEFKISVFDFEYAKSLGINSRLYSFILSALLVINIIIGIQISGAILISALIISPSVSARLWTDSLGKVLFISGFIGGISGFMGAFVSSLYTSIPTGPVIIVSLSFFVAISVLFSKKGIIFKYIERKKYINDVVNKIKKESDIYGI